MNNIDDVLGEKTRTEKNTCSTDGRRKSKLTGFEPGEDNVLVGESTNFVHCTGEKWR